MSSVDIIIEIPKGSRNKYEYDKEKKAFRLDRMIFSSVHYPADFGYIENTLAEDGDALDALVLLWEPTFTGCIVEGRPVGYLDMKDEKGQDEKILCVPLTDPHWEQIKDIEDVPSHLLKEIEHFFLIYKQLESKNVEVTGWKNKDCALNIINKAQQKFISSE